MTKQTRNPSPYQQFDEPNIGRLFFGRLDILEWINSTLESSQGDRLMLLMGESRMGKTALLRHLQDSQHTTNFDTIYVDCNSISITSLSQFLYSLSTTILTQLNFHEVEPFSSVQQSDFVAKPFRKFGQLLIDIEKRFESTKLLYLVDNFDIAWSALANEDQPESIFTDLNKQISKSEISWFIFTSRPKEVWHQSGISSFKAQNLTPLSPEETAQFFRQPLRMVIVDEVAEFIYSITNGFPSLLLPLGDKLFSMTQEKKLHHLTRADVITAALELNILEQADVSTHQSNKSLATIVKFQSYSPVFLAGLLLILLVTFFTIFISNNQARAQIAGETAVISPNNVETETVAPTEIYPNVTSNSDLPLETTSFAEEPSPTITQTPTSTPTPTSTNLPTPTVTSTPTATPLFYPISIVRESDNMPMLLVESGTFLMGSVEGEFLSNSDEYPQREVALDQFYIDQFEVSVEQYASFLNRLGTYYRTCDFFDCALPRHISGYTGYLTEQDLGDGTPQYIALSGFATYPMNHVSWYGAQNYCEAMGTRLPTEAEWEYAARGTDGRLYPWGNEPPNETLATFNSSSYDNLKPVDSLPDGVSPFGIYNMSGSLWEWTADWYDEKYYETAPNINPTGPETGLTKVIRGGGWPFNNQAERLRTANRNSLTPDFLSSTVGFRCASTP